MFIINKIDLKNALIYFMLIAGLIPLVIFGSSMIFVSNQSMEKNVFKSLNNISSSKALRIEEYFSVIDRQIKNISKNPAVIEAAINFSQAFQEFSRSEPTEPSLQEQKKSVASYYINKFADKYRLETSRSINTNQLIPSNPTSLRAQYWYISNNPHPLGEKSELAYARDDRQYSRFHKKYHPFFKSYLEDFGYYDIFIVEPKSGNIVYSVFKELDYATSLRDGPYRHTNFAKVFQSAADNVSDDFIATVDFEPYTPSYEAPASFKSSPIYDGDNLVGVLIFQMPVDTINKSIQESSGLGKTGESYLIGADKIMRSQLRLTDSPTLLVKKVNSESANEVIAGKSGIKKMDNSDGISVLSSYRPLNLNGLNWGIVSEIEASEVFADSQMLKISMIISMIIAAIVIVGLALLFVRALMNPINEFSDVMQSLSAGDLRHSMKNEYVGTFGRLKDNIQDTICKLRNVIENVQINSAMIANASEQVSTTAASLSQASTEQAASVEETSASIEQMGASINQNSENSKVTDGIAAESASSAEKGGEAVAETVLAMQKIAERISIIEDIAYQTNLLALNAAIEAARAGEHGKGFAVVATEVRKLAERSQVAASEISELTGNSTHIAERAGSLLEKMVPDIAKTANLVQEITAASEEQSGGVGQIAISMQQLDKVTQQNAASSEELAAVSEEMSTKAQELQSLISFFTLPDKQINNREASFENKIQSPASSNSRLEAQAVSPHLDTTFIQSKNETPDSNKFERF